MAESSLKPVSKPTAPESSSLVPCRTSTARMSRGKEHYPLHFFLQVHYFFLKQHTCIQLGEERFLEALNILSLPNTSLLLKIHQASSDPIGSLLWGFPDMLHISVAQTPNSCHKQSVSAEKPLWNTVCWEDCCKQLSQSQAIWNRFVLFLLRFAIWECLGGVCVFFSF